MLEAGIVGSLDYKIIQADKADDLYLWLKDNKYSYGGDEATLDHYIKKGWFFTVMKIDPAQMKKKADGSYEGEVTPTRFNFASDKPVYPLKITQISVKDHTEALLYVQAPHKMDLAGDFSYEPTWTAMWCQATSFAIPDKLTKQEVDWQKHVQPKVNAFAEKVQKQRSKGREPATLEWAKKITDKDIGILEGKETYNRDAPPEDVQSSSCSRATCRRGSSSPRSARSSARRRWTRTWSSSAPRSAARTTTSNTSPSCRPRPRNEGRWFDDMPRLANVLEKAGCEESEVLGHCRARSRHVRGCWLIDLILSKDR